MDITGKQDVTLIVTILMFYIFYHVTLAMVITNTLAKLYILDTPNNYIIVCSYWQPSI